MFCANLLQCDGMSAFINLPIDRKVNIPGLAFQANRGNPSGNGNFCCIVTGSAILGQCVSFCLISAY
nr:MAG TPA: hypothetical protein [Caudoviricetes sp.]